MKELKKGVAGACGHSELAFIPPHNEPPMGGRVGKAADVGLPQGPLGSPMIVRGLVLLPHDCPTAPGGTRLAGGGTTSSSSAASAEDPSTLGLGVRRIGEPELDPEASPVGLAIGAGGAIGPRGEIGTGVSGEMESGLATGPGPGSGIDVRREDPGASSVGDESGFCIALEEVARGALVRGRLKEGSKGDGDPKLLERADGAREAGCMDGPGPKTPNGGGA